MSADHLDDCARRIPDAPAVADGDVRLTYGRLAELVRRTTRGLAAAGFRPGDVATLMLPNWWEAVVAYQAVSRLGGVVNPVVPIFRDREVGFIVRQARPAVVVVPHRFRGFDHVAMLERILADEPDEPDEPGAARPTVVAVRPEGPLPAGVTTLDALGALGAGATRDADAPPGPVGAPDDVCLLLYTSGTTAEPKGVLHSHTTLLYETRSIVDLCGLGPEDRVFMPSPLTHITGFLYGLLLPPMTGTGVTLLDVWDPAAGVDLVERDRCRFTVASTPFLHGMVAEHERQGRPSSLRTFLCGGADVPPELVRRATTVLDAHVARVYGSSELPTYSCGRPGDGPDVCADTDGVGIGPVAARLDPPDATVGELLVKGPELFLGYLDPAHNDGAFDADGFFRTGDLASIDGAGRVTIRGRTKDIVVRGGENIAVKEVEDLLFGHPAVEQVAIVAMPDPVLVERACAFVVPAGGTTVTLEDLTRFLAEHRIARQKLPERLVVVDALPTTASGKVQKYLLRARIRDLLRHEEAARPAPEPAPPEDR